MNTMRDIRANHLYFAGLSIDPIRAAHLQITNPTHNPFRCKVSAAATAAGDHEDPLGQCILDNALHQHPERTERPVYIQERPISNPSTPPLFTVEFPERGCEFVLEETRGITQWYIQPLLDEDSPRPHDDLLYYRNARYEKHFFLALELFPVQWAMLNLLKSLYRSAYRNRHCGFPRCDGFANKGHRHYTLSILLAGPGAVPDPSSPDTTYMTIHGVCEDTKVMDIFETLAGNRLRDEFALSQVKWLEDKHRFKRHQTYSYKTVKSTQMKVKEWGWFGTGIKFWLLPLNPGILRARKLKVQQKQKQKQKQK